MGGLTGHVYIESKSYRENSYQFVTSRYARNSETLLTQSQKEKKTNEN